MHYIAQIAAAKLPVLAGAGILGVSIVGAAAGIIGATFTMEAEVISAVAGMVAGLIALKRRA